MMSAIANTVPKPDGFDRYVRKFRSICAMHGVQVGSGTELSGFLQKLLEDRHLAMDFWAFIGQPDAPETTQYVFLEVLLALSKALGNGIAAADLETRINAKLQHLATSLARLKFPRNSLPDWVRHDFTDEQLFWFASAMTAFYDEGI